LGGCDVVFALNNVAETLWKKRKDLPKLAAHLEPDDIEQLAQLISHYFHHKEGRGRNCKVEVFRRYNKEYFFAYPEDYAQSGVEWVSNALSILARHPAFEIIFVSPRGKLIRYLRATQYKIRQQLTTTICRCHFKTG
jgi:hypothetical protein